MAATPELRQFIEDSFFLLPALSPSVAPLAIPGVRGWVSPLKQAMMNRVGSQTDDFDGAFRRTRAFFAEREQGFTWVVDSRTTTPGVHEKMCAAGMEQTCTISGMCLPEIATPAGRSSGVRIEEAAAAELPGLPAMTARMFGISEDVARILFLETFTPHQKRFRSRLYVARPNDEDRIVAFAHMLYLVSQPSVLLRVAAVEPEYRGRGIYRGLVAKRLLDAKADGFRSAIVHAVAGVTAPFFAEHGFVDVCPLSLYHTKEFGQPHAR